MNRYTYIGCLSLVVISTFFIGKLQRNLQSNDAGKVKPVLQKSVSAPNHFYSSEAHVDASSSKMFVTSSASVDRASEEENAPYFSKEMMEREVALLRGLAEKYGEKLDLDKIANKNFLSEPYAGEEGQRKESILSGLFSTSRNLQAYNLKSIECRAHHCRVELFYQNKQDVEFALSDIFTAIEDGNHQTNFKGPRQNSFSRQDSVVSIYLADDFESSLYSEEDLK